MLVPLIALAALQSPLETKAEWLAFLEAQRADPTAAKLDVVGLTARAEAAGIVGAGGAKSPFAAWAQQAWRGGRFAGATLPLGHGGAPLPVGALATEREPNDSGAWSDRLFSDPLAFGDAVAGVIASGDVDTFRFALESDGVVDLLTSAGAAGALADSTLELTDARGGFIAFSDDALGFHGALTLALPAGEYVARVRGYGDETGSYVLTAARGPYTFGDVALGMPMAESATPARPIRGYRLELPSDGQVVIDVDGADSFDPVLVLANRFGGTIAANDDAIGLDSQIRIGLSAGSYLVYVRDFAWLAGDYTLSVSHTPGALLDACGGGTGSVPVPQAVATVEVDLAGPGLAQLELQLAAAPVGAMGDTTLELYDADWRRIATNDDATGLYSAIRVPLPAGRYRGLVRAFPGSPLGDFTVSARCADAAAVAELGCGETVSIALAEGGARAFRILPGAPVPFELRTSNSAYVNGLDSVAALFALDGALLEWNDDADADFDAKVGAHLPAEGAFGVVWGYGNVATGSSDVFASCPLDLVGTPALGATLLQVSLAKSGAFVVTLRGLPGAPFAPEVLHGLVLLDLASSASAGAFFSPSAGATTSNQVLPSDPALAGVLVRFQNVVLDPDRATGWLSNGEDVQL